MKACVRNRVGLVVALACIGSMLSGRVTAQTFTTVYNLSESSGVSPVGLLVSGYTLYGAAVFGGSSNGGTIFAANTDGSGLTTLYSFVYTYHQIYPDHPQGLVLSDNTIYGTSNDGGEAGGRGTVFAINIDGTGFTNLHTFTGTSDGADPLAGLVFSDTTLFGTTYSGGNSGSGTVFGINMDGSGFKTLHAFEALIPFYTNEFGNVVSTNSGGANPQGRLILFGNTLFGTANGGGNGGSGTVFKLNTDGTGFTMLHSFSATSHYTNSDGAGPSGGLILSGNTLYGTAGGGSSGKGTIFAVNTNGSGFRVLHSFTGTFGNVGTNSDGAEPLGLVLSGNILYGAAVSGGNSGLGTVFKLGTDGTDFTTLHSFTATSTNAFGLSTNSDGELPSTLLLLGDILYGTTVYGGSSGNGTIFSILLQPQLSIIPSGSNVILSWPTNYAGFDYIGYVLQSTPNLDSPAWTTNLPTRVIINGQNTVTTSISGPHQYFRLSQ